MDIPGLRRRSPNPNSPAPSSPAQSEVQSHYSAEAKSDDGRSILTLGSRAYPAPTIRLVKPSFSLPQPTPQVRSRSEYGDVGDTLCPPSADLRRSETTPNPRVYPSKYTWRPYSADQASLDRPVPPLPLNIRKRVEAEAEGTLKPAKSVGSSIFSLRNPFKWPRREEELPHVAEREEEDVSEAMSLRAPSMRSKWSQESSESATSTRPLIPSKAPSVAPPPSVHEREDGSVYLPRSMTMRRSSTGCITHLGKFPRSSFGHVDEGWTVYKWILLVSVISVLVYGVIGMCWALIILLRIRTTSGVTMASDPDIVIFLTLASVLCLFSFLVGLTGVLLESRPILAFYNLLLWPTFLSLTIVGYSAYKRGNLQLDRKLNQTWSRYFGEKERLIVQNGLRCCGYYSPFHDAKYSKGCYPRTQLPGCKLPWTDFERQSLRNFSDLAFSILAFHLLNIIIALICSNHVDNSFGKGLIPPAYRRRAFAVPSSAHSRSSVATLPRYSAPLTRPPSYATSIPRPLPEEREG